MKLVINNSESVKLATPFCYLPRSVTNDTHTNTTHKTEKQNRMVPFCSVTVSRVISCDILENRYCQKIPLRFSFPACLHCCALLCFVVQTHSSKQASGRRGGAWLAGSTRLGVTPTPKAALLFAFHSKSIHRKKH